MATYVKLDDVDDIIRGCEWAFDEPEDMLDLIHMIYELQSVEIMDASIRPDKRRFGNKNITIDFEVVKGEANGNQNNNG